MAKQKNRLNKRLPGAAVLRDKFVPQHLNDINRAPVYDRWFVADEGFHANNPNHTSSCNMEPVIVKIVENFIPRVPCLCGQISDPAPVHGPFFYQPIPGHSVPPDFSFGLNASNNKRKWRFPQVDLDETTSISEYSTTFRYALRSEHEDMMRMYEKYSLFKWQLKGMENNKARIPIDGIADARPALQIGDIVLLRPVQPIVGFMPDGYGGMKAGQYNIEIESRILSIVRGKTGKSQQQLDQVIIGWDLNTQQKDQLKDHAWVREYAIRFIPSSTVIDRSLTALDWLENLTDLQQNEMKDILFPVRAPVVKPLAPEQRYVAIGGVPEVSNLSERDSGDIAKPLNDLQASFVRMVRARTLDPSFEAARPPCILTGPAGTGKTKTLIYAIADVLGLFQHEGADEQKKNTNRVLVCCPSHAACDVLTKRLSGLLKRTEIFRLYDASRPSNTVPGYILPFTCQVPGSDRFTLPPPSVWIGLKVVVCTCMDAHLLFRAHITNRSIRAKQECFRTFLLSKSNPLGLSFGQVVIDRDPFFTHLFVDEAAQATEPEILCPISCVVDPVSCYISIQRDEVIFSVILTASCLLLAAPWV